MGIRATLLIGALLLLVLPARAGPPVPADLFSEDEAKALAAARTLSPSILNLREIRRQMEILRERPDVYFTTNENWGVGAVDLPVLWRRVAETGHLGEPEKTELDDTHRAMLPECIPSLVASLGDCHPEAFGKLAHLVSWFGEVSDDHHELVLRGVLHARERYEGRKPPPPAEMDLGIPEHGLPEAFVRLATVRWLTKPPEKDPPDRLEGSLPNRPWLRRFARTLTPAPEDLPFLERVAREGDSPYAKAWAVRAMGSLDDPRVPDLLREFAGGKAEVAAFAAAELARRGEPDRLVELLGSEDLGELAQLCALDVMPEVAREHWLAAWRGYSPDSWADRPLLRLQPHDRTEDEALWGVGMGPEAMRALAKVVREADLDVESRLLFYEELWPDALTGPVLDELIAMLRDWKLPENEMQRQWLENLLPRVLARVEVRRPEALRDLLHGWVVRGPEDLRDVALLLLARLGDDRHADAMVERWGDEELTLGRVRRPEVRAFLEEAAAGDDPERAALACRDLAEFHGLPDGLAQMFWGIFDEEYVPTEVRDRTRELLLAGDATGAAILLLSGGLSLVLDYAEDERVAFLGVVGDPRAEATLREWRAARRCYWPATAGLAVKGDAEARREIEGMIRDGRIWVGELIDFGGLRTLRGDRELVDLWIDRIDANCCLGFNALCALQEIYPTLDKTYSMWNLAETKKRIRAWYDRHEGHFAWSRILDGFVPAR